MFLSDSGLIPNQFREKRDFVSFSYPNTPLLAQNDPFWPIMWIFLEICWESWDEIIVPNMRLRMLYQQKQPELENSTWYSGNS